MRYPSESTLDPVLASVDDDDVTIIAALYDNGATTGHTWAEGDFNFDGKIDDSDVTVVAAFYNQTPSDTFSAPSQGGGEVDYDAWGYAIGSREDSVIQIFAAISSSAADAASAGFAMNSGGGDL